MLYLGLRERYDHLLHHNFVFSEDPEAEFDAIYEKGEPAPDPTCYLAAPSCTEPAVAPEGGEALYVLVHTPYLREGHDWSKMLPAYRRTILDKLARTAGMPDLEERIGRFMGAFKTGNRSRDVQGLYLAGGAAHPGPGVPMVLMSGWIAADCVDRDRRGSGAIPSPEEPVAAVG